MVAVEMTAEQQAEYDEDRIGGTVGTASPVYVVLRKLQHVLTQLGHDGGAKDVEFAGAAGIRWRCCAGN